MHLRPCATISPYNPSFSSSIRLHAQSCLVKSNAHALIKPTGELLNQTLPPSTLELEMLNAILGALKWGAVGFVVTLFLMVMFEASRIHDDIPVPEFKRRHTKRTAVVLSTFAGILSGLVWLLVQHWD